jgi:hypothetical protein
VSDEIANLPVWVRRRDGSQVPFDADRICQSLYAAAESLGSASAFLIRELTDVVVHFLSQDPFLGIPTTGQIADEVEKIVREVGQPALARRYAELRQAIGETATPVTIDCAQSLDHFMSACLEAYSQSAIFSPDVIAAVGEGLLRLGGLATPAALTSLVLETPRLADLPWWTALDAWRVRGGATWIVESPEWLCTVHPHPALTTHLCERLLALPMLADRAVELHLNVAEPPAWSLAHQSSPLFAAAENDFVSRERAVFLDNFLERWKVLEAPRVPALAWHVHADSFRDDSERQQLQFLLRQALQGKAIRFVFDRPRSGVALAEGLDRRAPGVLLEVALDLPRFAQRPEIAGDGAALLKKLPSLARIAVSAAGQKRGFLRSLPDSSPLRRGFLIERATCVVTPIGLDPVVRAITGASLTKSPLALDFALQILQTLAVTLGQAGRSLNLDLRVDGPDLCGMADAGFSPRKQLEAAGALHACAGAGTAMLLLADELDTNVDGLTELLQWTWESTGVVRLGLQRADRLLQQGELGI